MPDTEAGMALNSICAVVPGSRLRSTNQPAKGMNSKEATWPSVGSAYPRDTNGASSSPASLTACGSTRRSEPSSSSAGSCSCRLLTSIGRAISRLALLAVRASGPLISRQIAPRLRGVSVSRQRTLARLSSRKAVAHRAMNPCMRIS